MKTLISAAPQNGRRCASAWSAHMSGVRRLTLAGIVFATALSSLGHSQNLMVGLAARGNVQLLPSDSAILEVEDTKKDLPCTVNSVKPLLGFDLRFHSGYEITVPLREIAGNGDQLTIIFRVTSDQAKDAPVYFSQRYNVPD